MQTVEVSVPSFSIKTSCVACGCKVSSKPSGRIKRAIHISKECSLEIWKDQRILVRDGYKMCSICSVKNRKIKSTKSVEFIENCNIINRLIELLDLKCNKKIVEVKKTTDSSLLIDNMSPKECKEATGLTSVQLEELSNLIQKPTNQVFEFFNICKQGLSQRFAGSLYQITQSSVSYHFNSVLDSLSENFVPLFIGSSAFSKEVIKESHTPFMFSQIWPKVVGVIDGTYFYCQKSYDFDFQKRTFSGQKKRNLIKFMGIVLPDGRFFDLIGPFYSDGDHSDEWMWEYILENNLGSIHDIFTEDDEFLADRGFLRVNSTFRLHCPVGLKPSEKQLSAKDANESRLVTRFRNVVERAFGRLKMHWKILYHNLDSNILPNLSSIIRILAAVENKYYKKLWIDKDSDEMDLNSLKKRNLDQNDLENINSGWTRTDLEYIKENVPSLTMDIVREWCIGPYSIELSQCYLEHSSEVKYWKHKNQSNLWKVTGITSRFAKSDIATSKSYSVVLQIPLEGDIEDIHSYCSCKTGARTLGGCAHATSVLCHLTVDQVSNNSSKKSPNSKSKSSDIHNVRPLKVQKLLERKELETLNEMDDSSDEDSLEF